MRKGLLSVVSNELRRKSPKTCRDGGDDEFINGFLAVVSNELKRKSTKTM